MVSPDNIYCIVFYDFLKVYTSGILYTFLLICENEKKYQEAKNPNLYTVVSYRKMKKTVSKIMMQKTGAIMAIIPPTAATVNFQLDD